MLTAVEIASLIKTCSENRVTKFKAGEVEFVFTNHPPEPLPASPLAALVERYKEENDWLQQEIPAAPLPEAE